MQEFTTKTHKDLSVSTVSMRRLRTACERAKTRCRRRRRATIEDRSLLEGIELSYRHHPRRVFEDLFRRPVQPVPGPGWQVLKDAKMSKARGAELFLVGLITRIPSAGADSPLFQRKTVPASTRRAVA